MSHIRSSDGTQIAFTARGRGPALVLVGGALDDGAENEPLARELSSSFTVVNYARRGRGGSADTPPYAVAREIEDLAALITTVDGEASVFAVSSGGPLALEAAAADVPITRLALYDVPYAVAAHDIARWRDYRALLAGADPERALELFMLLAGSPEPAIEEARRSEMWPGLLALAPTLAYDAACLGDGAPPAERLAKVVQPTLVISGADSGPFFAAAADAVAAALPAASRLTLAGSGHVADPIVLGHRLDQFLLPDAKVAHRAAGATPRKAPEQDRQARRRRRTRRPRSGRRPQSSGRRRAAAFAPRPLEHRRVRSARTAHLPTAHGRRASAFA